MNEKRRFPPAGYYIPSGEDDTLGEGLDAAWDRLRQRTPEEEAESNEAVQFMARFRREHPEIEDELLNDPSFMEFLFATDAPEREQ